MSKPKFLSFQVTGVAVPAPRPSVQRSGVYMDRRSEHWKRQIQDAAEEAIAAAGWEKPDGPVELRVEFVVVRRNVRRSGPHTDRPDLDNLLKLAMDAMTRAGVYRDDGAVWKFTVSKRWQRGAETFAGVRVSVYGPESGRGEEE